MADHVTHSDCHFPGIERLAEKSAAGRKIEVRQVQLPRYHDDFNCRPTIMHGMGKPYAVHLARHLDVGAHQHDVGPGFQDGDGPGGVHRLEWHVSRGFHDVDRTHAEHHLVLDNENYGGNAWMIRGHHRALAGTAIDWNRRSTWDKHLVVYMIPRWLNNDAIKSPPTE